MSEDMNQKTPISVLQELCARNCLTPDYKLLSVEGAVHAPTFMYRVQVGEVVATATGQSKKKAKHAAAKSILDKLLADDGPFSKCKNAILDGMTLETSVLNTDTPECKVMSPDDDGITGNPVGQLQEKCMRERWRPPFYETVMEQGLPHERIFGITCIVNNYSETGVGKSKRLAKRQAAHRMLQLLESLDNGEVNGDETKYEAIFPESRSFFGLKDQKISPMTPQYSQQVFQLLKQLKMSDKEHITRLQGQALNAADLDHVQLLQEIGEEQCFEVTFVPVEELSQEGKHQCLVQLCSLPLAVCFGTGDTPEVAKTNAAHNALQYLKIMTKKK